jgi:aspartate kinase
MSLDPSAPRTVHKFGGVSLADGSGVRRVAAILRERIAARPIAVVSAIEGVTSLLDATARAAASGSGDVTPVRIRHRTLLAQLALDSELCNRHLTELAAVLAAIAGRRELGAGERDHVLSFGERISARIVAAYLSSCGVRAVPIDAFDLGLVSDSNHGRARVLPDSAARVRSALERIDGVPVITGFVAADAHGRLTTLGRNGSDLSAALIGEAIGAGEVVFWKDVGGVLSADPRLVPAASVLRELTYAEAAELTRLGASVLHPDAVDPLMRSRTPARVACVRDPRDAGTTIKSERNGTAVAGVACRRGLARARVHGGRAHEQRARLEGSLARAAIELLHVAVAENVLTTVAPWSDELGRALLALDGRLEIERELASIAAVGSTVESAMLRSALARAGVDEIASWRVSDRAMVALVAERDLARAAGAIHAALFESAGVAGRAS